MRRRDSIHTVMAGPSALQNPALPQINLPWIIPNTAENCWPQYLYSKFPDPPFVGLSSQLVAITAVLKWHYLLRAPNNAMCFPLLKKKIGILKVFGKQ